MAKKKKLPKISRWFKSNTGAETNHEEVSCKNCGTTFKGNYCPECGQSIKDFDQPFSFIFYNFMGDFFSFDVRFFRTFIALLIKPGFLTKEYFEGKRVRYAPPLRIFIFSSFVLFFLLQIYTNRGLTTVLDSSFDDIAKTSLDSVDKTEVDSMSLDVKGSIQKYNNKSLSAVLDSSFNDIGKISLDSVEEMNSDSALLDTTGSIDTVNSEEINFDLDLGAFRDARSLREGLLKLSNRFEEQLLTETDPEEQAQLRTYIKLCNSPEQVTARFLKYLSWAFFVLLPIFALLLKLFYIRRKHNYMKHLIFSIHIHAFVFIIISIITLLYQSMTMNPGIISFVIFLCIPIYLMIALKKFYGQSKRKVFMKFLGISFFYNIFFWMAFGMVFLNALHVL